MKNFREIPTFEDILANSPDDIYFFTHCRRESIELVFSMKNLILCILPKIEVEGVEVRTNMRWPRVRCSSVEDSARIFSLRSAILYPPQRRTCHRLPQLMGRTVNCKRLRQNKKHLNLCQMTIIVKEDIEDWKHAIDNSRKNQTRSTLVQ